MPTADSQDQTLPSRMVASWVQQDPGWFHFHAFNPLSFWVFYEYISVVGALTHTEQVKGTEKGGFAFQTLDSGRMRRETAAERHSTRQSALWQASHLLRSLWGDINGGISLLPLFVVLISLRSNPGSEFTTSYPLSLGLAGATPHMCFDSMDFWASLSTFSSPVQRAAPPPQ